MVTYFITSSPVSFINEKKIRLIEIIKMIILESPIKYFLAVEKFKCFGYLAWHAFI